MNDPRIDVETIRGHLRAERNHLFKTFVGNPSNTRLAIEIKLIDDQIAELAESILAERDSELESRADLPMLGSGNRKRTNKLESKSLDARVEVSNVASDTASVIRFGGNRLI